MEKDSPSCTQEPQRLSIRWRLQIVLGRSLIPGVWTIRCDDVFVETPLWGFSFLLDSHVVAVLHHRARPSIAGYETHRDLSSSSVLALWIWATQPTANVTLLLSERDSRQSCAITSR